MKFNNLLNVLALLLACQWTNPAVSAVTPAESKTGDTPSISFLRPIKGERFFDYPIFLQVQVSGFNLVAPQVQHGAVAPNTGHIQYSMDDYPVCTADDTQVMIGKKLGNGYVPSGIHIVKAQLVDVNGNSLKPPVMAVTEIFTGHPAPMQVNHRTDSFSKSSLTMEELYQMEVHLEELQGELRKIESGTAGYVPTPKGPGDSEE